MGVSPSRQTDVSYYRQSRSHAVTQTEPQSDTERYVPPYARYTKQVPNNARAIQLLLHGPRRATDQAAEMQDSQRGRGFGRDRALIAENKLLVIPMSGDASDRMSNH